MKRWWKARFQKAGVICIFAACVGVIPAAWGQNSGCTARTLSRGYGFRVTGFTGASAPFVPFSATGVQTFDGAGRFTVTNTVINGGSVIRNFSFAGTYTVRPDCTGTMVADFGNGATGTQDFVIVSNGDEIFAIAADSGNNWSGVYRRL